jgi:hypothetical protein
VSAVTRPKTLSEVRDGLCQMYADVMNDPRRAVQVHEGANALGKSIAACKQHLEFCALSAKKPDGEWARFIGG